MGTRSGLWVRSEIRRRRATLVLLTIITALVVAVVLAVVAGARRTTTAFDRYLAKGKASHVDVLMIAGFRGHMDVDLGNGRTAQDVIAELGRLPQVEAIDYGFALQLGPEGLDFYTSVSLNGYTVGRPRVLAGRLPAGVEEVALSRTAASVLAKGVGDVVEMAGPSPDQAERLMVEGDQSVLREGPAGLRQALRVVGVVEGAGDIATIDLSGHYGVVSADFYARYGREYGQFGPGAQLHLAGGFADVDAVRAAVERLVGDSEIVSIEDKKADVAAVNDAVRFQALALYLFAAVAAAAGVSGIGTALTRHVSAYAADLDVLGALGLTPLQRTGAVASVLAPVVAAGVLLGLLGAVAASPLLPLGLAGKVEPDPGVAVDAPVLLLGALAALVVFGTIAGLSAWRICGRGRSADALRPARQKPVILTRWVSRAAAGPVGATGLRLAFEPGSRTRPVPTRAALTAAVAATAGVAAVLVFGASLTKVVSDPGLSGFPFDAVAGGGATLDDSGDQIGAVMGDPDVAAVLVGELSDTAVAGETTQLLATRPAKGAIGLTLLSGRAPTAPDEVAVGPATRRRLPPERDGLDLATEAGTFRHFRIVGIVDFPILNYTGYDNGVWLTLDGFEGVRRTAGNAVILIRLQEDAQHAAKRDELGQLGFDFGAAAPAKVSNLAEVKAFPQALAAFLALLGVVIVGHAVASSTRRLRREFAVLRALGMVTRQISASVAVQATAVSAVGLVLGLPLGTAAGRNAWNLTADSLSVVPSPVVPVGVFLVVPATIAVANLLAVSPARQAARMRSAEVLRTE